MSIYNEFLTELETNAKKILEGKRVKEFTLDKTGGHWSKITMEDESVVWIDAEKKGETILVFSDPAKTGEDAPNLG